MDRYLLQQIAAYGPASQVASTATLFSGENRDVLRESAAETISELRQRYPNSRTVSDGIAQAIAANDTATLTMVRNTLFTKPIDWQMFAEDIQTEREAVSLGIQSCTRWLNRSYARRQYTPVPRARGHIQRDSLIDAINTQNMSLFNQAIALQNPNTMDLQSLSLAIINLLDKDNLSNLQLHMIWRLADMGWLYYVNALSHYRENSYFGTGYEYPLKKWQAASILHYDSDTNFTANEIQFRQMASKDIDPFLHMKWGGKIAEKMESLLASAINDGIDKALDKISIETVTMILSTIDRDKKAIILKQDEKYMCYLGNVQRLLYILWLRFPSARNRIQEIASTWNMNNILYH